MAVNMQNPIHFHRTVSGNRLRIALIALSVFIITIAGLYYYFSFKKSHIPLALEGTWVCQQYLDSIIAKQSVAKVLESPLFVQLSFKKGWADSVISSTTSSSYRLRLNKISKGKYLLLRFSDTLGMVTTKKKFLFEEKWSGLKWQFAKVDTAFKALDKGQIFQRLVNKVLVAGRYLTIFGKSLEKEVVFTDSGGVVGIKGIKSYRVCYNNDCRLATEGKDALQMNGAKSSFLYAFERIADTLTIFTVSHHDSIEFNPYWKLVKIGKLR